MRRSWLLKAFDEAHPEVFGIGECAPLVDLSMDYSPTYCDRLRELVALTEQKGCIDYELMRPYPSILFGLETAMLALGRRSNALFDTAFASGKEGIPINGLVWMGAFDNMLQEMERKVALGFPCVKLKIGAIGFDDELTLIKTLRKRFSRHVVELRLDANGAFSMEEALYKLELLSQYGIHSIEQPIKQKQWAFMAQLCRESPLPIALDEELIGVVDKEMKHHLLSFIKPQYIVLKPSLHGGMAGSDEWIAAARDLGIGFWITSALESNIGLNAVAQYAAWVNNDRFTMSQGLGTGLLFSDNVEMPVEIRGTKIWYNA